MAKVFNDYKDIYCWAFFKHYNYHKVNPRIIQFKSAFGNLGFNFRDKKVHKKIIKLSNSNEIYLDIVKIDCKEALLKLLNNRSFEKKMGLVCGSKIDIQSLEINLSEIISEYFSTEYELHSKNHLKLIDKYLRNLTNLDYTVIYKVINLREYIYGLTISKSKISNTFIFSDVDRYYFGFPKPYEDFVRWKSFDL